MTNDDLLQRMYRYSPTYAEIDFKRDILEFIQEYPDCFERSLAIGHVTASAWLVSRDMSKALMIHHAKLDRWFQPGGHCDGDVDTLAVALKEAREESGITGIVPVNTDIFDIDIHLIPPFKREAAHYHYDIRYLLRVDSDEKERVSRESKELRWIGKDLYQLPTDNPSVLRMFTKWLLVE